MLEMMVSGDSMSPHQAVHIGIIETLVERKLGNSSLQDHFWCRVGLVNGPLHMMPIGRDASLDLQIGRGLVLSVDKRRVIIRNTAEVMNIVSR